MLSTVNFLPRNSPSLFPFTLHLYPHCGFSFFILVSHFSRDTSTISFATSLNSQKLALPLSIYLATLTHTLTALFSYSAAMQAIRSQKPEVRDREAFQSPLPLARQLILQVNLVCKSLGSVRHCGGWLKAEKKGKIKANNKMKMWGVWEMRGKRKEA